MLLQDWMTTQVISVNSNDSLMHCLNLFKEHRINTMPVVDDAKKVAGIVLSSDIRSCLTPGTTGIEVLENVNTLNNTRVHEIMNKKPVVINSKRTVNQAALLMSERNVWALPVVDDNDTLVGFMTEWDVFKALVTINGSKTAGRIEAAFDIENRPGELRRILDELKLDNLSLQIASIHFSYINDKYQVMMTIWVKDKQVETQALNAIKSHPGLRYWAYEDEVNLRDIP